MQIRLCCIHMTTCIVSDWVSQVKEEINKQSPGRVKLSFMYVTESSYPWTLVCPSTALLYQSCDLKLYKAFWPQHPKGLHSSSSSLVLTSYVWVLLHCIQTSCTYFTLEPRVDECSFVVQWTVPVTRYHGIAQTYLAPIPLRPLSGVFKSHVIQSFWTISLYVKVKLGIMT